MEKRYDEKAEGYDQLAKGYDDIPKRYELTKYGAWGLQLLRGFFAALHDNQLPGFLHSHDVESFLRESRNGPFGGKLGDGQAGSEFPGTGAMDPLDVLQELFRSMSSGIGETDRPGGVDPAAAPGDGHVGYVRHSDGTVTILMQHGDGSSESVTTSPNGRVEYERVGADRGVTHIVIAPDTHGGGFTETKTYTTPGGVTHTGQPTHFDRHGRQHSPGEGDSGDSNSGLNPLSGIDILAPQSMSQMIAGMQHPGKDPNELDQNTGKDPFKLTEAQQERLGRTVPASDVLDPNSGIDPLSQLHLDPYQIKGRTEDDDRIDPNTGLDLFFITEGQAEKATNTPKDVSVPGKTKVE